MTVVELWPDGAISGNPDGPGGWAVILRYGDTEREMCGYDTSTTNNRMEMMAVIRGLEELSRPCEIRVFCDSKYVCKGFTDGWIEKWEGRGWINSQKEPVANRDLWERLVEAVERHERVEFIHVHGHAGWEHNERADALAVQVKGLAKAELEDGGLTDAHLNAVLVEGAVPC